MAESTMNKPEIETLSYHSSLCKCPECKKNPMPKQLNKLTTQTLEKSERGEDLHEVSNVEELLKELHEPEQPKRRICKKCQVLNCSCRAVLLKEPEQPNTNVMLIQTIQGLTTAILNDISKLPEGELKDQAYDDMNIFETGILFKLQKEYE